MTHCIFSDAADLKMQQMDNFTGVGLARWVVTENDVSFENARSHTLSLYLSGGDNSFRYDKPEQKGGTGKLCTMPKHQSTFWAIKDTIQFAHLYFPQSALDWFIGNTFERDARNVNFPVLLYEDDPTLRRLFLKCFNAHSQKEAMLLEEKLLDVLYYLFNKYLSLTGPNKVYSSGLSPFHRKLIRHYINDNYSEKLSISRLAALTNLNDFHFAKMFKISFGKTPSEYITKKRVQETKRLLKTKNNLANISQENGFSHQSHMTQIFKFHTGFTPYQYQKKLKELE